MTMSQTGATSPEPTQAGLPAWLRPQLRCPVTGEELVDGTGPDGAAILISRGAALAYPVRSGVPVLLAHEALGA